MLVLALKNSTKLCWISYENFAKSPTIPHFVCAEFMQGFMGMRRHNMTVVYVGFVYKYLHWDRGSIPTPTISSSAIPLGKGLIVHYLVFSDGA